MSLRPIIRALVIEAAGPEPGGPLHRPVAERLPRDQVEVSTIPWTRWIAAASSVADVIIVRVERGGHQAAIDVARLRPDVPVVAITSGGDADHLELLRQGVEEVVSLDDSAGAVLLPAVTHAIARRARVDAPPKAPAVERRVRRGEEADFKVLAEAMPAAVFIARNGRIVFANRMMCSLTGHEPADLLGTDPDALFDVFERDTDSASEETPPPAPFDAPNEVLIRTRGGEPRWIDLTTAPITFEGHAATIGIGIDISERKRLEHRARQRQQFEALGRLAGGVAHDFNNLLLVISGEIEVIAEQFAEGSALRASADAVAKAAHRASALTGDLLAFGRRQMLFARPIDVNEIVSGLSELLGETADQAVDVSFRLTPGLPVVRVDRPRLEQALLNLITNARDAIAGRGSIVISTDLVEVDAAMQEGRPWLAGGTWVRLVVADTGHGIPAGAMPHVFEPFFSTRTDGPSSGLGLSTVFGIVKQSGGFVWIDSEPGTGTRVTILLPPAGAEAPDIAPNVSAAPAQPSILVVDDESEVLNLLTTVLARAGFTVHSAPDAETALELASGIRIDVLLTDVILPGLSGPELAARIRTAMPHVRVLLMSGYTGDSLAEGMAEEREFISKPFTTRLLVDRLRALLETP